MPHKLSRGQCFGEAPFRGFVQSTRRRLALSCLHKPLARNGRACHGHPCDTSASSHSSRQRLGVDGRHREHAKRVESGRNQRTGRGLQCACYRSQSVAWSMVRRARLSVFMTRRSAARGPLILKTLAHCASSEARRDRRAPWRACDRTCAAPIASRCKAGGRICAAPCATPKGL
jgi:hypothetical protein